MYTICSSLRVTCPYIKLAEHNYVELKYIINKLEILKKSIIYDYLVSTCCGSLSAIHMILTWLQTIC